MIKLKKIAIIALMIFVLLIITVAIAYISSMQNPPKAGKGGNEQYSEVIPLIDDAVEKKLNEDSGQKNQR